MELHETKLTDSSSIFFFVSTYIYYCAFTIILYTKPEGTRRRDFLSLQSKLTLESAK